MKSAAFQIEFGKARLAISAETDELREGAQSRFRHMLSTSAAEPTARLTLVERSEWYRLEDDKGYRHREDTIGRVMRLLEARVVELMIEANPQYIWLHSGGVVLDGRALLLVGQFGSGKSTLVTTLLGRGWKYLSDDVVPLDPETGRAHPFPRTPNVREGPSQMWSQEQLRELRKKELQLDPAEISSGPAPIAALLFPKYNSESELAFEPCKPAVVAAHLIENTMNFAHDSQRSMTFITGLARRLPALRVVYRDGGGAAESIERRFMDGFQP